MTLVELKSDKRIEGRSNGGTLNGAPVSLSQNSSADGTGPVRQLNTRSDQTVVGEVTGILVEPRHEWLHEVASRDEFS